MYIFVCDKSPEMAKGGKLDVAKAAIETFSSAYANQPQTRSVMLQECRNNGNASNVVRVPAGVSLQAFETEVKNMECVNAEDGESMEVETESESGGADFSQATDHAFSVSAKYRVLGDVDTFGYGRDINALFPVDIFIFADRNSQGKPFKLSRGDGNLLDWYSHAYRWDQHVHLFVIDDSSSGGKKGGSKSRSSNKNNSNNGGGVLDSGLAELVSTTGGSVFTVSSMREAQAAMKTLLRTVIDSPTLTMRLRVEGEGNGNEDSIGNINSGSSNSVTASMKAIPIAGEPLAGLNFPEDAMFEASADSLPQRASVPTFRLHRTVSVPSSGGEGEGERKGVAACWRVLNEQLKMHASLGGAVFEVTLGGSNSSSNGGDHATTSAGAAGAGGGRERGWLGAAANDDSGSGSDPPSFFVGTAGSPSVMFGLLFPRDSSAAAAAVGGGTSTSPTGAVTGTGSSPCVYELRVLPANFHVLETVIVLGLKITVGRGTGAGGGVVYGSKDSQSVMARFRSVFEEYMAGIPGYSVALVQKLLGAYGLAKMAHSNTTNPALQQYSGGNTYRLHAKPYGRIQRAMRLGRAAVVDETYQVFDQPLPSLDGSGGGGAGKSSSLKYKDPSAIALASSAAAQQQLSVDAYTKALPKSAAVVPKEHLLSVWERMRQAVFGGGAGTMMQGLSAPGLSGSGCRVPAGFKMRDGEQVWFERATGATFVPRVHSDEMSRYSFVLAHEEGLRDPEDVPAVPSSASSGEEGGETTTTTTTTSSSSSSGGGGAKAVAVAVEEDTEVGIIKRKLCGVNFGNRYSKGGGAGGGTANESGKKGGALAVAARMGMDKDVDDIDGIGFGMDEKLSAAAAATSSGKGVNAPTPGAAFLTAGLGGMVKKREASSSVIDLDGLGDDTPYPHREAPAFSLGASTPTGTGSGSGSDDGSVGSGSHYPPNGGIGGYSYPPGGGSGGDDGSLGSGTTSVSASSASSSHSPHGGSSGSTSGRKRPREQDIPPPTAAPAAAPAPAAVSEEWNKEWSRSQKRHYWFNARTKQSVWEDPSVQC